MIDLPAALSLSLKAAKTYDILNPDGSPYITRHVLWGQPALGDNGHDRGPRNSAFIHRIHTADSDRHLHDHPWAWGIGVILSGGYTERRWEVSRCSSFGKVIENVYRPGDVNVLRHGDYHAVHRVERDTVTLFLTGPIIDDWGFLVDGARVPHREYLAARPENRFTHTEPLMELGAGEVHDALEAL